MTLKILCFYYLFSYIIFRYCIVAVGAFGAVMYIVVSASQGTIIGAVAGVFHPSACFVAETAKLVILHNR